MYTPSYASSPDTVPQFLPDFAVRWLPPINFRPLIDSHHPHFPIFTLPHWPGIVYFVIGMSYNIALLLFAFLPFFLVVKKWKPVTWGKALLAIFATAFLYYWIVWGISDALVYFFGSFIDHSNDLVGYIRFMLYPLGPLLTLVLAFSPFYWAKKIYQTYTWARFFGAAFLSLILLAIGIFFWYEIIIIGAGEFANFING